MEAASPPLSFPVSAVQATGPPLRPQGSLPRSLRDGHCGPPLTPEPSTAPHHAVAGGQEQSPCPPNRTALTIQIPQNKVSTVTGDCQHYRKRREHGDRGARVAAQVPRLAPPVVGREDQHVAVPGRPDHRGLRRPVRVQRRQHRKRPPVEKVLEPLIEDYASHTVILIQGPPSDLPAPRSTPRRDGTNVRAGRTTFGHGTLPAHPLVAAAVLLARTRAARRAAKSYVGDTADRRSTPVGR